jgi:hypothetical protein
MSESISKDELEDLYWTKRKSIREISTFLKLTKGQVEHLLEKYNIPRRTVAEAAYIKSELLKEERIEDAKSILEDTLNKMSIKQREIKKIKRSHILVPIRLNDNKDCTITLVLSDFHIGDANHLPDTFWSTIKNAQEVIKYIKKNYIIKGLYIELNGDLVAGRNVYKFQELRNLLSRGHWQVFLCEYILKKVFEDIEETAGRKIDRIYMIRGTHENLDNNFILYLKRLLGSKARYLSHEGVVNIADPIGEYNVLFTHGLSYSDSCPVPPKLQRDCLDSVAKYRSMNINVERICTSHTHWLCTSLLFNDIAWDVTGGFQKWEYTLSNRPSGGILYLYNNNEVSAIPIRPDPEIEDMEDHEVGLEYKNLVYYGNFLLKHLKEIEGINK